MARKVPSIVFGLASLELEDIIFEIVDNSLDSGCRNVHINFFESKSTNTASDVGFAVFDDGNGFKSIEDLYNAFEIQEDEDEKTRSSTEIGKYHVGLKIAPLSKYKFLYIFTRINEEEWYCVAKNPEETETTYDMDQDPKINPTWPQHYSKSDDNIPSEVHDILSGFSGNEGKWKTCVVACERHDELTKTKNEPVKCWIETSNGLNHLKLTLGMTYEKILEQEKPPKIHVYNNREANYERVIPVDPMWKQFTPKIFDEKKAYYEKALSITSIDAEKEKYTELIQFCEVMAKFGTYHGYPFVSAKFPGLTVTPYIIPASDPIRDILKKNLPDLRWDTEPTSSIPMNTDPGSGPSNRLKSDSVRGLFFYRDNRLVTYGNLYKMEVSDHIANSIRVEVRYTQSLDKEIKVSPNKERIKRFGDGMFEEILRGLEQKEGGVNYAPPFNAERPFFIDTTEAKKTPKKFEKPNNSAQYPNLLKRGSIFKYESCSACSFAHYPGEICPELVCGKCGQKAKGCSPNTCVFVCTKCTITGTCKPSTCVNECEHCEKIHPSNECDTTCPKGCGKSVKECACACALCGKKHDLGDCEKLCDKCKQEPCNCQQADSTFITAGPRVMLQLFKKNKTKNIDYLKSALEKLDIAPDDLK